MLGSWEDLHIQIRKDWMNLKTEEIDRYKVFPCCKELTTQRKRQWYVMQVNLSVKHGRSGNDVIGNNEKQSCSEGLIKTSPYPHS